MLCRFIHLTTWADFLLYILYTSEKKTADVLLYKHDNSNCSCMQSTNTTYLRFSFSLFHALFLQVMNNIATLDTVYTSAFNTGYKLWFAAQNSLRRNGIKKQVNVWLQQWRTGHSPTSSRQVYWFSKHRLLLLLNLLHVGRLCLSSKQPDCARGRNRSP